jgi:hypothetical protein
MKALNIASSFRIGVCAALALGITALTTQSIVQLAGEPRHSAAQTVMVAQQHSGAPGSITVALAR